MSAKLVLDTAAMQEDFFADTALIGIVSPLPAYRFCWMLNERLDLNFTRDPEMDIVLQTGPTEKHYFQMYMFSRPVHGSKFFIYKLKSGKEVLLPEVKQLDYLWMIESASPEHDANFMVSQLRNIPDVQLAQVLTTDRLKNLSHLLV